MTERRSWLEYEHQRPGGEWKRTRFTNSPRLFGMTTEPTPDQLEHAREMIQVAAGFFRAGTRLRIVLVTEETLEGEYVAEQVIGAA